MFYIIPYIFKLILMYYNRNNVLYNSGNIKYYLQEIMYEYRIHNFRDTEV